MKHLLLLAFSVVLFSCSNKKEEIVEQIKSYKDSLNTASREETILNLQLDSLRQKYSDSLKFDFETKDLKKLEQVNNSNVAISLRKEKAQMELERLQFLRRAEIKVNRAIFKAKIDSLELELKKY